MPIRQDDNQPNRRFGIVNIILIGVGALLLFSSLFPNQNMQIPRVPYSLFIDQVNDGEVKRAYITQELNLMISCISVNSKSLKGFILFSPPKIFGAIKVIIS